MILPLVLCIRATSQQPTIEFMPLEAAQPILREFSGALPAELSNAPGPA